MADLIIDGTTSVLYGLVDYSGSSVIVRNGGMISVPFYDHNIPGTGSLEIRANSITVDTASYIDANYSGYRGGHNNGNLSNNGEGQGGGIDGEFEGGGGGYGGIGGNRSLHPTSGSTYGTDIGTDIGMGSGGGASFYFGALGTGGNGGGSIKLVANSITINGIVESSGGSGLDGTSGGEHGSGGGSGGGIYISGSNITITGHVLANGGIGGDSKPIAQRYGGDGGGGGRIKISSTGTIVTTGATITANGGRGGFNTSDTNNNGQSGSNGTVTYPAVQPTGQTLPLVYNISTTPSTPNAGQSVTITAQIANIGVTGKVRVVFKVGDSVVSDQNTDSLQTFPSGMWSPSTTYTMPNNNITIIVDVYGTADNGATWSLNDTESINVIPGIPTCTGIVLTPYSQNIDKGGSVAFSAGVTPTTYPYIIQFMLRDGTILGTVTSSGGWAHFTWNTSNNPPPGPTAPGTYYVKAIVQNQGCFSTESTIQISPPITQWTLDIYVKDINTNVAIQGADVTILTQTLQTDNSGHVQFIVNDGTNDIMITDGTSSSTTNYNSYTTSEYFFNNKTVTYYLAPVTTANGSLRFIVVAPGSENESADIYFTGVPSPQGTTDPSTGILIISGLAHSQTITYTAKKTGYNDFTGTVTIVGGTTVDVPISLSLATPTTGDVCLKSNPSGASIKIDGNIQTGKTTALSTGGCTSYSTITGLSPGTNNHTYLLQLTGYQDSSGTFSIAVGQTTNLDAGDLTILSTTGSLTISSSPNGARIYIDNVDTQYITPATILNISEGDHTYLLKLKGYQDATDNFHIDAGQTTTVPTVTLIQMVGGLRFFSTPGGSNISIGGMSKGTTTIPSGSGLTVPNLPIGKTDYVATLSGYDTYNGGTTVVQGTTTDVTITLLPTISGKGSLAIDTNPHGAEIFINGTDKSEKTPQTFTDMDTGGYTYELKLPGYYTISGTFQISGGQTTSVYKTFQRLPVSQAGFGIAGMILVGGLAIGALYSTTKKKEPEEIRIKPVRIEIK